MWLFFIRSWSKEEDSEAGKEKEPVQGYMMELAIAKCNRLLHLLSCITAFQDSLSVLRGKEEEWENNLFAISH